MGEVLLARDTVLDRKVALKQVLGELAAQQDFIERFSTEARALARVRHPGVTQVHDFLRDTDGAAYLVLEYVPGESLADVLRGEPRLPWPRCAELGAAVCDALHAAHLAGVIHRDIKPGNILIEPDGTVRVADFGIARLTDASSTKTGLLLGTPTYMAPEVGRGKRADARTDVYGIASVLFEVACGRPPYVAEEDDPSAVLVMHLVEPVPDARDMVPDLPAAAVAILQRGMAKAPDDRFADAAEMAAALRDSVRTERRPTAPADTAEASRDASTAPPSPAAAPERTPGSQRPAETEQPPASVPSPTVASVSSAAAEETPAASSSAAPPTRASATPAQPAAAMSAPDDAPSPTRASATPAKAAYVADAAPARVLPTRVSGAPARPDGSGDTGRADATRMSAAPARRPAESTTEEPQRSGRRRRAVAGVIAAGAVAGLAVGLLVGRAGGGETPEVPTTVVALRTVSAPAASVRAPADWTPVTSVPPEVRPLALAGRRVVRPADAPNEFGMAFGISDGIGAGMLPTDLTRSVSGALPDPTPVRLGSHAALRFSGVQLTTPAGSAMDLYIVPTSRGALTVSCFGATARLEAMRDTCARIAATLRPARGVTVFALTPDPAYAAFVSTTVRRANRSRSSAVADIRAATTRAGQAEAASRAATAYADLRSGLAQHSVSPQVAGPHSALVRAAGDAAQAYRDLSAAASSGSATRWNAARSRVRGTEAAFNRSLGRLSAAGYAAGGSSS